MTFSEGNLLRINQSMWFFLSFYLSVVGFLLSSVPEPFHSHLWVGVGWEEGEGLELGIDIISRQLSKLWWCANQSVLTSSLFSYSLSFHIPVFRFAIVKFVVKIFLHYLILLNPSVSSDSTSLLSSPPPPPPPLLSSPHPHPFPLLIRGIFASEGHWEQQADLCPKPTFAYEYD